MKQVYYNGKIYVERGLFVDAMVVNGAYVESIGRYEDIVEDIVDEAGRIVDEGLIEEGLIEEGQIDTGEIEYIDLEGSTVIPGFNDSHCHMLNLGIALNSVMLYGCTSTSEIIERGQLFLEQNPNTKFLQGNGWNQDFFDKNHEMPTRYDLDKISEEIPIIFTRACGHICVGNSKALELANITKNTKAMQGGMIYVDDFLEPNGLVSENAMTQITAIIPEYTSEEVANYLKKSMAYCARFGITSVQTGDIREDNYEVVQKGYEQLYQTYDSSIRSYQQTIFSSYESYEAFVNNGNVTGAGDNMYKIGPLKMFVDGSLGARTALLRKPYEDNNATCGIATMTQEHLEAMMEIAEAHGCQIAIHCIGDGAIEMVLNAYDKFIEEENQLRHGIFHCQITDKYMIERFVDKDILAYIQPIFIDYDMNVVYERVGRELADTSYLFGTMYRKGIKTAYGTDAPVEDANPYRNIYCAITRKNVAGTNEYLPEEKVDIYDAIDQYTIGGAYMSYEEKEKGRLKSGYLADFIILDRNIFTIEKEEILEVQVMKTFVGGREVYSI